MTATDIPEEFRTASELLATHRSLTEKVGESPLDAEPLDEIRKFVHAAVAAGRRLDSREERRAAQGCINYWVSAVGTAAREQKIADPFGPGKAKTVLADIDPGLVASVATAAEHWVSQLSDTDREVARKVILRLVRLNSTDNPEPITIPRDQLADIQPQERVHLVLDQMIALGVVRAGVENGHPVVSLRSGELTQQWGWLAGLIERRVQFRKKAVGWVPPVPVETPPGTRAWVAGVLTTVGGWLNAVLARLSQRQGDAGMGAFTPEELHEAEDYRDRSDVELRVVFYSRQVEKERNQLDRVHKGLFAGLSVLLGLMTLCAAVGWWIAKDVAGKETMARQQAEVEQGLARNAEAFADLKRTEADDAAKLADARKRTLERRQELTGLRLLLRHLADVATARTLSEREVAIHQWNTFAKQIASDEVYEPLRGRPGLNPDDLLRQAASDQDRKLSKLTIEAVRRLKVDGQQAEETEKSLRSMRTFSFEMVRKSATRIVTALDAGKRFGEIEAFEKEFWRQYWGEMILVEGSEVETEMYKFGQILLKIRAELEQPDDEIKKALETTGRLLGDDWKDFTDRTKKLNVQTMAELREKYSKLTADQVNSLLQKTTDRPVGNRELIRELKGQLRDLLRALDREDSLTIPKITDAKAF